MHTSSTFRSRDHLSSQDETVMPRSLTPDGANERRDFMAGLNDAVRDNPVPAALIGMGVLWMFLGGKRTSVGDALSPRYARSVAGSVARQAGSAGHSVVDAAGSVVDAAGRAVSSVSSTLGNAADTLVDFASNVGHALMPDRSYATSNRREIDRYSSNRTGSSSSRYGALQHSVAELFDERPLLLGAAGLAIGAGIAASLPLTRTEQEVLGKASGYVHGKASEVAGQVREMAAAAADEVKSQSMGHPKSQDTRSASTL